MQISLGKADTALQEHQSLAGLVNTGSYNTVSKKIELKHDNTVLAEIDATEFVKDGMVSSVVIEDGNLVITFNTDSGKEAITIPLIDIFNPANYYTKTYLDGKLVPATTTTLGLVKLYNTDGTNKSGLLVQEDGGLVINVPNNKNDSNGIYRDGKGQLKANIKAPATDAEIEAGTSTEKAITPSNLSKVKESFGLATVATSGSYNDLNDKPTIPTKTSELNNDSGFLTEHQDISGKVNTDDIAKVATSGSYNDLSDKPTIPTVPSNVSAFNNDAGYITEDDVDDVPTANSNNPVKSGGVYSTTPSITNTDAESDLDFSDEDGNILMRLSGGHIETKYFNSSNLPSGNIVDTSSKAIYTVANTLTNGQTMTLNNPNLKNHYTLSFSATVNTMGTIIITFGSENAWSKGRVEITPTNIVYYQYSTWEPITIQHNIDIQENISVIIKTTKVHFAEIYLLSNNSNIFHQEISWNGSGNGCALSNANGSYSNCTFSLNCQGLLKDVWIFGDSYTNRWPLCLDELGFDNYLLDGFSGRNSQQAYESLLKDIAIAKPKAIIWMMGMNDPDNGSVNSSWKTAFDNVKTLCDAYKIEFIYTTIPCVPQRDNSYKNNYAITSGVRIIPIASILGASSQGSSWYAGLLSSDNVHPSNSGSLWIALTLLNNITLLQEK